MPIIAKVVLTGRRSVQSQMDQTEETHKLSS